MHRITTTYGAFGRMPISIVRNSETQRDTVRGARGPHILDRTRPPSRDTEPMLSELPTVPEE